MKRIFACIAVLLLLAPVLLSLSSCAAAGDGGGGSGENGGTTMTYTIVENTSLEAFLNNPEADYYVSDTDTMSTQGYFAPTDPQSDGQWHYIIAATRNTGGYSMQVQDVQISAGEATITIEMVNPEPGSLLTMAFTNPACEIIFSEKPAGISVTDTNLEHYEQIGQVINKAG
ncbi:MAG: protease complex subunit PrcB family protein [Coriobacteriales bacterium]|jgi:hypothetical protein|nr:protease complex subunit PrcB family protein [Coriobacteriales bacterium]